MSKKSKPELHGVKIVNTNTIDMTKDLAIIEMKLKLQILKREEFIDYRRRTTVNNFRFGKVFRRLISLQITQYEDDIEYIKTQLLLLGKPYGQN